MLFLKHSESNSWVKLVHSSDSRKKQYVFRLIDFFVKRIPFSFSCIVWPRLVISTISFVLIARFIWINIDNFLFFYKCTTSLQPFVFVDRGKDIV